MKTVFFRGKIRFRTEFSAVEKGGEPLIRGFVLNKNAVVVMAADENIAIVAYA